MFCEAEKITVSDMPITVDKKKNPSQIIHLIPNDTP